MPQQPPAGLKWRSHPFFIVSTVAIGLFADLFLFGLVVPIVPFLLHDRLHLPGRQIQSHVSAMLAAFSATSLACALPAGWMADRFDTRRGPYLGGLVALVAATLMLAFVQTFPLLILSRALQGLSAAIVDTSGLAMIIDTVSPDMIGRTLGTVRSFVSLGVLSAPIVGGILYHESGYGGVFGVSVAILVVDTILRLLVIEKKISTDHSLKAQGHASDSDTRESVNSNGSSSIDGEAATEHTGLIPFHSHITSPPGNAAHHLPLLICLVDSRLVVALLVVLVQATFIGAFNATVPTEAAALYDFSSLGAGLLFLAIEGPGIVLAPLAGWAIDHFGPRSVAVAGFTLFVPGLTLLRLPAAGVVHRRDGGIALFATILAVNGVALAFTNTPGIVEAMAVVGEYHVQNPDLFGADGSYGQLCGLNALVYNTGLTVGPLVGGVMRESIGYGNMNAILAMVAVATAILALLFIESRPIMCRAAGSK